MPAALTPTHIRLQIAGMNCGSCVSRVRSALERVGGIHINDLRPGSAVLELQPGLEAKTAVAAVAAAGYQVLAVRALGGCEESPPMSATRDPAGCCCAPRTALRAR